MTTHIDRMIERAIAERLNGMPEFMQAPIRKRLRATMLTDENDNGYISVWMDAGGEQDQLETQTIYSFEYLMTRRA